jgi:hypothetical protein
MGRVELVFDRDKLQYSVAVLLVPVTRSELINAEFLVDTGSNTSGLSEETARKVGIDPDSLSSEATVGVGGITQEPIYRGNLEAYLNANLDKTLLKNPRVFFPITRKARKKMVGKVVAQKIQEFPIPNLLGMDALSSINGTRGKLHLDLETGSGFIEW